MDKLSPEACKHVDGGGWTITLIGAMIGLMAALCCWRLLELI